MRATIYRYYIPVLILLMLAYTAKINWKNGQWQHAIEADAKGYFAYLPAVFVYQDLNFSFYETQEVKQAQDSNLIYDYRAYHEGKCLNKYYVGEALLISPFYYSAHLFTTYFSNLPTTGYSQYYVISVTIAALFYLWIACYFLEKTFEIWGISQMNRMVSIVALVLGTNLFYYSIGEMGMSHVYSFSMVSAFSFYIVRYFNAGKNQYAKKELLFAAFFLGLIILIRPINGLVIFSIPFLAKSKTQLLEGLKGYFSSFKTVLLSALILFSCLFIQAFVYKIQTGQFWVYSYGEEGFNFTHPEIIPFLFSYKKGFFLYTPLALLAMLGFLLAIRKNVYQLLTASLFILLVIYILSSWWMWFYGGSFSSRVMVDYLPYFGLMLAIFLQKLSRRRSRIVVGLLIFVCFGLNQLQTLQYRYYIIHWSEMTKEKYWDVFLDVKNLSSRRSENELLFD